MAVTKVAVLGATGAQGGEVVAALCKKGVEVVAITRNLDSDKAKALAEKPNVSVRKGDLNDVESLKAAFEGCDGAFVIANFWETMNVDIEMQQYKNAADALKATPGITHVVFSSLDETVIPGVTDDFKVLAENESGKMYVPHFDGKARSEKYFEGLPTTFILASCYFENFGSFFSFAGNEDGSYSFTLPLGKDKKIPWTILPDVGALVAAAFMKPEQTIGKHIGQASFSVTGDELAEIHSKATGKTIKYNCVPYEVFAGFGFPGAEELAQMMEHWVRTIDDFNALRSIPAQEELIGAKMTDPVEYGKTIAHTFTFQEFQKA